MTHEIPVDSKSETRLLVIFSLRALATTAIGVVVGGLLGLIFSFVSPLLIWILMGIFGLNGFIVGTFKIPEISTIPFTKEVSGLYSYEAVFAYMKFKSRRKLYVYSKTKNKKEAEEE